VRVQVWLSFGETISFETVVQGNIDDETVLDSVCDGYDAAAASYGH